MLKKLKGLFIILIIVSSGCDDITNDSDIASSFFPLLKGNKWYYSTYRMQNDTIKYFNPDLEYDGSSEIVGTTKINDKTFFIFIDKFYSVISNSYDTTFYRF